MSSRKSKAQEKSFNGKKVSPKKKIIEPEKVLEKEKAEVDKWKTWTVQKREEGYGWSWIANNIQDQFSDIPEKEFVDHMSKIFAKPKIHDWEQTGGDVNAEDENCYLTRVTEKEVDVVRIDNVDEPAEKPTKRVWRLDTSVYDIETELKEFDPSVASFVGIESEDEWKKKSVEELAESFLDYYGDASGEPLYFDTFEKAVEYITGRDITEVDFWSDAVEGNITVDTKTYTRKQIKDRKKAVVECCNEDMEDIKLANHSLYGMPLFEIGNREYAVGTDEEADIACHDDLENFLEENGVESINGWDSYIDDKEAERFFRDIYDEWNRDYVDDIEKESSTRFANRLAEEMEERGIISEEEAEDPDFDLEAKKDEFVEQMTSSQIEEGNGGYNHYRDNIGKEEAKKLLKDNSLIDKDALIQYVIDTDGRGHMLSSYDGDEHEIRIGDKIYYVYRQN